MFPTYQVFIRKDASTITPVTIVAHELPILRKLFGEEYVQDFAGRMIERLDNPVGQYELPADEYERLCQKYRQEVVDACYKKSELERIVAQAAAPKGKKGE